MNKEEINAIKCLEVDMLDNKQIEIILNLIEKQQKEIEEYKTQEDLTFKCLDKTKYMSNYISKDKILKAIGYEENDEEYKRIYNKEELILSLIKTIYEECDRLEDIEDRKIQVEIQNIERRRDNDWKDKIRELLKKYEKTNIEDYQAIIRFYKDLEELLEEE